MAAPMQQPRSGRQAAGRRTGRSVAAGLLAAAALALLTGCFKRQTASGGSGVAAPEAGFTVMELLPKHFYPKTWIVGKIVQSHFPGALPGPTVMNRVMRAVKPWGLTKENTIYGQSICSDEINSDPGHISTLLTRYYGGRSFPMGGIGGAPYVGKTGFMAFSHHVPKNGHVFVLFGPHIGFSPDGVPGQFLRLGQDHPSTSCGAAIAALGQVTSGAKIPADDSDIMQGWLRNRLAPHCPEITAAKYPMIELAIRNYQVAEKEMVNIVNNDYGPGKLILLGGIQINMPYPMPGYFLPMHFSVRARDMAPVDLMSKLGVLRPKF